MGAEFPSGHVVLAHGCASRTDLSFATNFVNCYGNDDDGGGGDDVNAMSANARVHVHVSPYRSLPPSIIHLRQH